MIDRYKELEFLPTKSFGSETLAKLIRRDLRGGTFIPIGTINYKECLGDKSDGYMHGSTVLLRTDIKGSFEDKLYIEPHCDVIYMNNDKSLVLAEEKKEQREQDLLREESKQYGKVISVGNDYDKEMKYNPMKLAREKNEPSTFARVDTLREVLQAEITNPSVSINALHILKAVYHNCYYMVGHMVTDYAKAHLDEVRAIIVSESICADSIDIGLTEYSKMCLDKYKSLYRLVNSQQNSLDMSPAEQKKALLDEFLL